MHHFDELAMPVEKVATLLEDRIEPNALELKLQPSALLLITDSSHETTCRAVNPPNPVRPVDKALRGELHCQRL